MATQIFFPNFHPEAWGRWTHFDDHIFQMGGKKPPTGLNLMSATDIFPATLKAKSDGRTVRHARSSSIESQYFACRSRRIRPPFSVPKNLNLYGKKRRDPISNLWRKNFITYAWVIGSSLYKPHLWPLRTQSLGSFRVKRSFAGIFFVPPGVRGNWGGRGSRWRCAKRIQVMINGFNLHQIAPWYWK